MIASTPSTCSLIEAPLANLQDNPMTLENWRIQQAQNGNLEAFNELVLAYQDRVFRQALWIMKDEPAAEDACQEAFLRAYRKISTFHGGPFLPWLIRIVTNGCLDQIRMMKRKPCHAFCDLIWDECEEENEPYWVSDPAYSPETIVEQGQIGEVIQRALQKLQLLYRLPVILVDLQELDYVEAAAILQVSLGTFKSRLARARAKLREDLSLFYSWDRKDAFASVQPN